MNLREHVMETVAVVEVTVPAGELLELLDERDAGEIGAAVHQVFYRGAQVA